MRLAALIVLLATGLAAPAGAESLITTLSTSRVAITSNYTGTQVVMFGAIVRDAQTVARSGGYDVVVTVRGPRQSLVVREKEAIGPVWINREQQKFIEVPAYLGVLASQPIAEVTSEPLRRRLRIGIDAIINSPDLTMDRGSEDDPFRAALVRLKSRERLFVEDERGVTFLTPTIFRAPIPLPAIAPPGEYQVEVALFADDVLLSRDHTYFELYKIGFEQRLAEIAQHWSALYGLATGALAILFGWIASVIFRRD